VPIACDPKQRFRYVLQSDEGEGPRPTFVTRYLTGREQLELMEISDQVDALQSGKLEGEAAATMRRLFEVLDRHVVGTERMDLAEATSMIDVLTLEEAIELFMALLTQQGPRPAELGKSESPSPTSTGGSAEGPAATAAAATAPTGPAHESPPSSSVSAGAASADASTAPAEGASS